MAERVSLAELVHFTEAQIAATKAADDSRFFLFGGSRGPGKSYWLRWYLIRFLLRAASEYGLRGTRVMLACENYPVLKERQISKILTEFPEWLGYWHGTDKEFRLWPRYGSGVLCLRNLDDPSKYQSAEYAALGIDELTKNPERTFTLLRGSMRWPGLPRTQFVAATNPNGPGATWVRRYWIEREFPENLAALADEFRFLPAKPGDNPHLSQEYWDLLDSLPETLRKAWRDGDWYAGFEGLVYGRFGAENITQLEPDPTRSIELAFDDGYIDPRAILLIQRTPTYILVFDELYQRRTLAEESVNDVVDRVHSWPWPLELPESELDRLREAEGWPRLPEIAVGSPEAKELQARFRMANIPVRSRPHKIVNGIDVVRRLICDGNGYRALLVHSRCRNFISELTEGYQYPEGKHGTAEKPIDGNDHACDAFRYWAFMRG